MSDERIGDLTSRVSRVEQEVSDLKVSNAEIAAALTALADSSKERFNLIQASLDTIHRAVGCKDDTDEIKAKVWLREILTPQTIAIILAILASALGAPMVSQSILETSVSPPPPAVIAQDKEDKATDAPSPSDEKVEEKSDEASPE